MVSEYNSTIGLTPGESETGLRFASSTPTTADPGTAAQNHISSTQTVTYLNQNLTTSTTPPKGTAFTGIASKVKASVCDLVAAVIALLAFI
jgi:hypothetical protein